MKILGISLGSSKRDKTVTINNIEIQRMGTDGSLRKARRLYKKFDGNVDAFGMGGIDLYLWSDKTKFMIKDAKKLIKGIKTPVLDGSGLKNYWEPLVIENLQKKGTIDFRGKNVLLVSAVDRFQIGKKLEKYKAKLTIGDFIFGLDIPLPIHSLRLFKLISLLILPIVTKLPFKILYPTGKSQESSKGKYQKVYNKTDIIIGDFHYIKKHEPKDLTNKIFITNTVTKEDIDRLEKKHLKMLVTTTPNFEGRSFGTNVIEALIVTLAKKQHLTKQDYINTIKRYQFDYFVKRFTKNDSDL